MSLQTGGEIARTAEPIIDPAVLEIVAYSLHGVRLADKNSVVLTNDIREVGEIGIIVDSNDELVPQADVVKIQKLDKLDFHLIDMQVIDDKKTKLGKIYDYSIDPLTFTIHQLFVKRPLLKSLQTSNLIINRSQIAEINNKAIVVHSATLKQRPQPAVVSQHFVNPFRSPAPRPDSSDSN